ncbi:hypothetical protein D3C76_959390 [compost metagenome]
MRQCVEDVLVDLQLAVAQCQFGQVRQAQQCRRQCLLCLLMVFDGQAPDLREAGEQRAQLGGRTAHTLKREVVDLAHEEVGQVCRKLLQRNACQAQRRTGQAYFLVVPEVGQCRCNPHSAGQYRLAEQGGRAGRIHIVVDGVAQLLTLFQSKGDLLSEFGRLVHFEARCTPVFIEQYSPHVVIEEWIALQ